MRPKSNPIHPGEMLNQISNPKAHQVQNRRQNSHNFFRRL